MPAFDHRLLVPKVLGKEGFLGKKIHMDRIRFRNLSTAKVVVLRTNFSRHWNLDYHLNSERWRW
jgi:hypothetical protein